MEEIGDKMRGRERERERERERVCACLRVLLQYKAFDTVL